MLASQRLQLREFRDDDLDVLAAMVGDDEQMTFSPLRKSRDEAAAWIRLNRELYATRGFGTWVIEVAPQARFAGYCGIRPLELEQVSEIEIGWHVHKRFWNQGIATEAASLVCRAAATRWRLSRLVALVHPTTSARDGWRRTSACAPSGRRCSRTTTPPSSTSHSSAADRPWSRSRPRSRSVPLRARHYPR